MASNASGESRFYVDQTMIEPEVVPIAGGHACVFSARCPTKETANEDAAAVLPFDDQSAVLLVADGLGGSAAGELASRLAIESIGEAVSAARGTDVLLRTAIINGIDRANSVVQELGIGAATTLAAVEVNQGSIRPFHVGDSAILVVGGRGKLKFQSISHSPVGYGLESGLLDEAQAMSHEDRHVVSNVIGMAEMRIDIGPTIKLQPRDTLLLATDGLADNLEPAEMCRCLTGRQQPEAAVAELARLSTHRMNNPEDGLPSKPDDLTMISFRLS